MRKRVIRAGEIEIEDADGRVRARFGVSNDDFPFFAFYGRTNASALGSGTAGRLGWPRHRR